MAAKAPTALKGSEVLLCVTGGIACYKSADLASKLIQAGAGVTVAMTEAAARFVAPLTFQTITQRQVFTSMWQSTEDYKSQHLALTELADIMVVAPATANFIARFARGLADDLVSALALAAWGECPVLVAPAMNPRMWQAPPTRDNVKRIESWGAEIIGPGVGFLACRTVGAGRMIEPADIFAKVSQMLRARPAKKRP